MTQFLGADPDQTPVPPPRRHDLLIAFLQVLAAALAVVPFVWPWAARHRIYALVLATGVIGWIANPRLRSWAERIFGRRRDSRFVAADKPRLGALVERFAVFTSNHDNRSFIQILRSVYSNNFQAVEQIVGGDYIGSWLHCYREQLFYRTNSLEQHLSQCREFGAMVQAFNTNYVLRAQRQLAGSPAMPQDSIGQLEQFREEWNAFLRDMEPWGNEIMNYLRRKGVTEDPRLWTLAPTNYFERPKSFARAKHAGG